MKNSRCPGALFAVEGIDGAGKSTLIRELKGFLEHKGACVQVATRYLVPELTRLWLRLVRDDLVNQPSAAIIAVCDYFVGLERNIRPALEQGAVVLADRYFYSHLVYFYLRGLPMNWLQSVFSEALIPDRIFYISIPPEQALARLKEKGKPDFWEAGLDHRLGLQIGSALLKFQREPPSQNLIERHFLEYQREALSAYSRLLPAERTHYLDGLMAEADLAMISGREIEQFLGC